MTILSLFHSFPLGLFVPLAHDRHRAHRAVTHQPVGCRGREMGRDSWRVIQHLGKKYNIKIYNIKEYNIRNHAFVRTHFFSLGCCCCLYLFFAFSSFPHLHNMLISYEVLHLKNRAVWAGLRDFSVCCKQKRSDGERREAPVRHN